MKRIRMKQLYTVFEVLSQHMAGGTKEYYEPAQ
jgi:hypothetical protein